LISNLAQYWLISLERCGVAAHPDGELAGLRAFGPPLTGASMKLVNTLT